MARATWNGAVLAESDAIELVEGNVYFPPGSVRPSHKLDGRLDDCRGLGRCVPLGT